MEDNQAIRYNIQKETKVAENSKVSKRFTMKQKLEWHTTWLQQQTNGYGMKARKNKCH